MGDRGRVGREGVPTTGRRGPSRIGLLAPALLALATFTTFASALQGEFLAWDDVTMFLDNPGYRGLGPSQLRWIWTTLPPTWASTCRSPGSPTPSTSGSGASTPLATT